MGTSRRAKEQRSDRASWPDEHITDVAALPSYWPERMTEAVLAEAAHPPWVDPALAPLEPLWDRWFDRALEEGVEEDLASLGRTVIREAGEQDWDEELRGECGWFDDGEAMLDLAMLTPERAEARWRALLDRD